MTRDMLTEIEKKLKERCDIPIFHDDQHGTAVITLAGLTNALKVVDKKMDEIKVVINGAGAAAIAIGKLLLSAGVKDLTLCDRSGAVYEGRPKGMNPIKDEIAKVTNLSKKAGSLADMLVGADVFIGVSAPGAVTTEMVKTMNRDAIMFACANPTPEIFPDDAKAGGARVISTGRSDFPNQINNVLAFPGIFRGALDARASDINDAMKIAAAKALAGLISDEELNADYIIPAAFDPRVKDAVASAVKQAAYGVFSPDVSLMPAFFCMRHNVVRPSPNLSATVLLLYFRIRFMTATPWSTSSGGLLVASFRAGYR